MCRPANDRGRHDDFGLWPLRLRQINLVSRHLRHLALRTGHDRPPCRCYGHAVAAAAVRTVGHVEDRGGLSLHRGAYGDKAVREALELACLASLACEIDSEDNWPQRLSGGEQQRLAIARAILDKPDWLFLDEATSALDDKLEAEIYRVLSEVLPNTTIVSIGHRSTLTALHRRHIEMEPGQAGIFEPTPTMKVGFSAGAQPWISDSSL